MLVQTLILHGPVDRYDWTPIPRSDAKTNVSSQLDRGDLLASRYTKGMGANRGEGSPSHGR